MGRRDGTKIRRAILRIPVVLLVLSGAAAITRAVRFFLAYEDLVEVLPGAPDLGRSMGILAGVLALVPGAAMLLIAFGLLKDRAWARTAGIVVASISAFFAIPVLTETAGLVTFVVDLVIVAILAWDAMTDYPEEAIGPTWGEFGRGPTESREADPPTAN